MYAQADLVLSDRLILNSNFSKFVASNLRGVLLPRKLWLSKFLTHEHFVPRKLHTYKLTRSTPEQRAHQEHTGSRENHTREHTRGAESTPEAERSTPEEQRAHQEQSGAH